MSGQFFKRIDDDTVEVMATHNISIELLKQDIACLERSIQDDVNRLNALKEELLHYQGKQ